MNTITKKLLLILAILTCVVSICGCATFSDSPSSSGQATFKIHIASSPDNAEVFLNGVAVGKTPCSVSTKVTYGLSADTFSMGTWRLNKIPKRTIEVVKDGYRPVFESLEYTVGSVMGTVGLKKSALNFTLKPEDSSLNNLQMTVQRNDSCSTQVFKKWMGFPKSVWTGPCWQMELQLPERKTVASMTIRIRTNKGDWEAGTNRTSLIWWPLLVIYGNELVNNSVEYSFGSYQLAEGINEAVGVFPKGKHVFILQLSRNVDESVVVQNAILTVNFNDGVSISADF